VHYKPTFHQISLQIKRLRAWSRPDASLVYTPSLKSFSSIGAFALSCTLSVALACVGLMISTRGLQDAIANGETRTISIYHTHTKESASITFRRNGSYDRDALEKLNWMLRDWRSDEKISMDPRLFDVVWEAHRESGSSQPLHVVSAYRSPNTNAMLRRRSRGVAKHSQHTQGKAMDFYLPDVDMGRVRAIGMRLQRGGVGYYPSAFNPFVHLDAGSVRSWPRMSRDQLARIFPDGRTVHLPADGKPLQGYQEARATILARGGAVAGFGYADADEGAIISGGSGKSLWAALFGGDEDADSPDNKPVRSKRGRDTARGTQVASNAPTSSSGDDAGSRTFFNAPSVTTSEPRVTTRQAPVAVASLTPVVPDVRQTTAEPRQTAVESPSNDVKPKLIDVAAFPAPRPSDLKGVEPIQVASLINVQLPPSRPSDLSPVALRGAQQEIASDIPKVDESKPVVVAHFTHPEPPSRPLEASSPSSSTPLPSTSLVSAMLPPVRDQAHLEALTIQTASLPQRTPQPVANNQQAPVITVQRLFSSAPLVQTSANVKAPVVTQAKAKKFSGDTSAHHMMAHVMTSSIIARPIAATRFQNIVRSEPTQAFSGDVVRPLAAAGFEKL